MREVQVPPTGLLQVRAIDPPDAAGLQHVYAISGFTGLNASKMEWGIPAEMLVLFQNGPVDEGGVNGVTNEVALAIVADRLRCLQIGPYATGARERALQHLEEAQRELASITTDRRSRGVEGTPAL